MLDTRINFPSAPMTSSRNWDKKAVRHFVDALGASAWDGAYDQTFGYRWRGEDTLTWGNAHEWIRIKWLAQRFFGQELSDASSRTDQPSSTAAQCFAQEQPDTSARIKQGLDLRTVVNETRIATLKNVYTFHNPEEVTAFLSDHEQIIPVLWDARPVIVKFFGEEASVVLDVVYDPEASHNSKQLFGYIHIGSMSPDEAFERLNAFDEAWFLKQFDLTGGLFNFNLG